MTVPELIEVLQREVAADPTLQDKQLVTPTDKLTTTAVLTSVGSGRGVRLLLFGE